MSRSKLGSRKPINGVFHEFPAVVRVTVVDDDDNSLNHLEAMLKSCQYEVTKFSRAEFALDFLRCNKDCCDVVLSDVYMPHMGGFELLQKIRCEMDLPVIMMSEDDSDHVMIKGLALGAWDCIKKTVSMEKLAKIWCYVVGRQRMHQLRGQNLEHSGTTNNGEWVQKLLEDVGCSSSAIKGSQRSSKKSRGEEIEAEESVDSSPDSPPKKRRFAWSRDLHDQFVTALNQIGIEKAVPKKILKLMKVDGLTREHVARHLQKYRLSLKRKTGGLVNSHIEA